MTESEAIEYIQTGLGGVDTVMADGNSFFCYDPGDSPPDRRFPFATLVANDDYEHVSDLNRPGVYRLNIGVSKETFRNLLGVDPPNTKITGKPDTSRDYTVLDQFLPHPVYGSLSWVCVLNPSENTWETVCALLKEAHDTAAMKHERLAERAHKLNEDGEADAESARDG